MGQIKKKGTSGNAKNFITRTQAVRKLQISLQDFRRLCIFKGIYPREPRSKKRASKSSTPSTTFYYSKDIQYLLHEPLINKFRDQKILAKKVSKALGRNEASEASRYERNLTPKIRLDHIIKERYPTFDDALRDLDDALSLLFLFANLPSTDHVPPKTIAKCQRLTMEFEHYIIRTTSLRKSFLSIKGIYYSATIHGQDILWLVPYKFVQRAAGDVDYRIMATFVEFYTALLGFVNYRLYTGIGLVYPPKFDVKREEQGAELGAFQLEGKDAPERVEEVEIINTKANQKAQEEADKIRSLPPGDDSESSTLSGTDYQNTDQPIDTALDQFSSIDPTADALLQPSKTADSRLAARLFEPFTFYLSRETPRHDLEFMSKAFGCKRVGWDSLLDEAGSFCNEDDERITHQIVDRPDMPLPSPPLTDGENDDTTAAVARSNQRVPGRIYVQPQWVVDSLNAGQLQRADIYAPGAELPPHLSPWVKPKKGEYDPTIPLAEQQTEAEAEDAAFEDEEDEEEEDEIDEGSEGEEIKDIRGDKEARKFETLFDDGDIEQGEGMDVRLADSDEDEDEEPIAKDEEWGGLSGDDEEGGEEDEAAAAEREHQAELEAEALGLPIKSVSATDKKKEAKSAALKKRSIAEREAAEDIERRKMMMPRRKRKLYEKMVYSNSRKDEDSEKLRAKKRKIEKANAKRRA